MGRTCTKLGAAGLCVSFCPSVPWDSSRGGTITLGLRSTSMSLFSLQFFPDYEKERPQLRGAGTGGCTSRQDAVSALSLTHLCPRKTAFY